METIDRRQERGHEERHLTRFARQETGGGRRERRREKREEESRRSR